LPRGYDGSQEEGEKQTIQKEGRKEGRGEVKEGSKGRKEGGKERRE
jgi:hypothetical protein